jgi:sorting nexin-3/12
MTTTHSATARIQAKQQTLEDAYSLPANFLEIDIADPQTHGHMTKNKTENTSYYSD